MLSDHEQRALEDLERSFATESGDPAPSRGRPDERSRRRGSRPPGTVTMLVLGTMSVFLFFAGVPVAALALAAASALGWLLWRLASLEIRGEIATLSNGAGSPQGGPRRRPGDSIRNYLRWLAEAE